MRHRSYGPDDSVFGTGGDPLVPPLVQIDHVALRRMFLFDHLRAEDAERGVTVIGIDVARAVEVRGVGEKHHLRRGRDGCRRLRSFALTRSLFGWHLLARRRT